MRSLKLKNRPPKRRSIYVLPNIFTTLSLFFGFYSILAAIDGRYSQAAWLIFIAALSDGLDGTVARMTNTTSRFGMEYDSLCDLVAFGAAPAVLAYLWVLTPDHLGPQYQRLGVAAAFIFLACGALRLARFNVFSETRDPGFFQGLPIPGGALMVASTVLWHHRSGCEGQPSSFLILGLLLTLAFLMVSNIDYVSHKNKVLFRNSRPFETLVLTVLLMGLIIAKNRSAFLPLGLIYLASGPVVTMVRARGRRRGQEAGKPRPEGDEPGRTLGPENRKDEA
ncbi:MAG: CDP-diacylglycerol--serine O-phosphatidyltransferase [Deltaproteobacteria bacterium]|nr:CDP-diacylglycerol--serine O-phosphatidyltransferase [Deltaproteobacteria bacterium]